MNIKVYTKGIMVAACCAILFASCEKDDLLAPSASINSDISEPDAATAMSKSTATFGNTEFADVDPVIGTFVPPVVNDGDPSTMRFGEYEWGQIKTNLVFTGVTPNQAPTPPIYVDGASKVGGDLEWGKIVTNYSFANTPLATPNGHPSTLDYSNRTINPDVLPDCGFPIGNDIQAEK